MYKESRALMRPLFLEVQQHMKIAIIGTAGRQQAITKELWEKIKSKFWSLLVTEQLFGPYKGTVTLDQINWVSGGAAGIDHLAVRFCGTNYSSFKNLTLHLPSQFSLDRLGFHGNRSSATANYYHRRFSNDVGINSLGDIKNAISGGAQITISDGFFKRNLLIGKVDIVLAMTFGSRPSGFFFPSKGQLPISAIDAGLEDGGTSHTWDCAEARNRVHINLNEL